MGTVFSSEPLGPSKQNLVKELKSKKMTDINECVEVINASYATKLTLNSEEFEEVFGSLLGNTEEHFIQLENTHNLNACVDVYESLSVFVILSGENFNEKLKFIFGLFDFDGSGHIEEKEMVMSLQSVIRGLCKYVNLSPPALKDIEKFSQRIFLDVDLDSSNAIDFEEFQKWVRNNYELQDFLLKFSAIQTHENAMRRTTDFLRKFRELYHQIANTEDLCPTESFVEQARKNLPYLDEEGRELFLEVLIQCSNEMRRVKDDRYIVNEAYEQVIRAMAAFCATDINSDHQVNREELRYLLYAFEDGDDPDSMRIEFEMKQLDKDKSG
jgi:Ca2+-binding EF-hand superfamily protein